MRPSCAGPAQLGLRRLRLVTVTLRSRADISLDAFYRIARQGEAVVLHQDAIARITTCREAFLQLIDSDEDIVVYGVISGYGQMADLRFTPEERRRHAGRPMVRRRPASGSRCPNGSRAASYWRAWPTSSKVMLP